MLDSKLSSQLLLTIPHVKVNISDSLIYTIWYLFYRNPKEVYLR